MREIYITRIENNSETSKLHVGIKSNTGTFKLNRLLGTYDNRAYSGRQECSCTLSCHVSIELNTIDITSKASLTKCASNNIDGEDKDSKSPTTLLGT